MRIAHLDGRAVLLDGDRALDVAAASAARFPADPALLYRRWDELRGWAAAIDVAGHADAVPWSPERLAAPSPRPARVIGIGLNYADHAAESDWTCRRSPWCSPSSRPR